MWILLVTLAAGAADLQTIAEKTSYARTGRYDEVVRLCAELPQAFPGRVRCDTFGQTPEGRPMLVLAASSDGVLSPGQARDKQRPVVLFQGGIHAGEIDGKDAGFAVLRRLLAEEPAVLSKVTAVFVPVLNVDGHERFTAWGRPNQNGPEEHGWRVTGQNLNLNRDYVKADAPEMRALLALLGAWDPLVYLDLHVTDGAKFRHDVAVLVDPSVVGPVALKKVGLAYRAAVAQRVAKAGHLPITEFYPSFETDDDPSSGFHAYLAPPRFSSAYWALQNRIGVLVETHSWKDYATRVHATEEVLLATLRLTGENAKSWLAAARDADREAERLAGQNVPIAFKATDKARLIEFLGYAYSREPSPISGALWTRYDTTRPEVWKIPLRDEVAPTQSVRAPGGGYVVPAAWYERLRPVLEAHGVEGRLVAAAREGQVEVFRAESKELKNTSYEGRQQLTISGSWKKERRVIEAGSFYVPVGQRRGRLVMQLFEPAAPDALLRWGFFNAAFERKEYMEDYVAEEVARGMLAKDPALTREFEEKLAKDDAFRASAEQRLEFFFRRTQHWDDRYDLYPVVRVEAAP